MAMPPDSGMIERPHINYAPPKDNSGGDEEKESKLQEYEAMESYKRGTALSELLRSAENPEQVRESAMLFCNLMENTKYMPESAISSYRVNDVVASCMDRSFSLGLKRKDLIRLGILNTEDFDSSSNTGSVKVGGFAISEKSQQVETKDFTYDPKTKEAISFTKRLIEKRISHIGSDSEREKMAKEYDDAAGLIQVRQNIAERYLNLTRNSENLEGIVKAFIFDHPTTEGIDKLFNFPEIESSVKRIDASGVEFREGHEFGDKIDAVIRIYSMIGMCEKKSEFLRLRNSPGWKFLFSELGGEAEEKWVGKNFDRWKDNGQRSGDGDLANEDRGNFTKHGNIFADRSISQINEIRDFVKDFLGGDSQAEAAESVGFKLFNLMGLASEEGWEYYLKDGGSYACNMGFPNSDDLIKVIHPDVFRAIYREKWSYGGPTVSLKAFNRFAVSFLRYLTLGEGQNKRSLWEMMWHGDVNQKAICLGEVPWTKEYNDKFENKTLLSAFFGGREGGLYEMIMKTDWRREQLTDPSFWGNLSKSLRIAINESVALNGEFAIISNLDSRKAIVKDYRLNSIISLVRSIMSMPITDTWRAKTEIQKPNEIGIVPFNNIVAKAINEANIGIRATVDNNSRLQLDKIN